MSDLYSIILKRKSVRKFSTCDSVSQMQLDQIGKQTSSLTPLVEDIKTKFIIVPREKTDAKFGQFCLLMYSEKKDGYLQNAGYMLQQMELIMDSMGLGVCWCGQAAPADTKIDGLDFVVMLLFGKPGEALFRENAAEFIRLSADEIWRGEFDEKVKEAVRLTPSARNSQPWRVESIGGDITVYRKVDIGPFPNRQRMEYFNPMDMGIFMCCLEVILKVCGYEFTRSFINETGDTRFLKQAVYNTKNK